MELTNNDFDLDGKITQKVLHCFVVNKKIKIPQSIVLITFQAPANLPKTSGKHVSEAGIVEMWRA